MVKVQPIFDKVLIANRGEIACRVIKTCNRLGIKTVAIHSTADEQSKHVKMADEAVCVGPPTSAQSYLVIDKVIDACLKTGAQAVHPGYGFLSENADFSAALKKHNIVFIGPDAHSIEAMGDKIESKRLAKQAGVTTIPGYIGEIVSHKQLLEVAREIGYPVMVKASGGGGGKGMRIANNDEECIEFFDMCKEEARAAFNNDKMLVEKFIENPRHIEVQVIADRHGNAVYLNERECSIQRRNQKVLEEAPSPLIDPVTRKAMGEQAVALAKAVQYVSAGTVENVVNPSRQFYFLEMNTRLQVEHPITELITGVDIVEQMLRAAAGLKLSITQDDVKIHGHATEARVYAEDPMKNYFPSIGRLSQYVEPHGDGVRVDSGILEGSQISVYYDPLISKLCTWGKTRDESLDRMEKALDEYVIRGLNHNVCLLRDVITQEKYRSGDITTSYLAEQYPHGFHKAPLTASEESLLLTSSCIVHAIREASAFSEKKPINTTLYAKLPVEKDEHLAVKQKVHIIQQGPKEFVVSVDDGEAKKLIVDWKREFPVVRVVESCGKVTVLQFWGTNEMLYQMQMKGTIFNTLVMTELQAKLEPIVPKIKTVVNKKEVKSPMPGVIVALSVEVGKKVVAGQELLTLEAMKMRNKIRAQHDGTIKEILVNLNATVDDGQLMILFE